MMRTAWLLILLGVAALIFAELVDVADSICDQCSKATRDILLWIGVGVLLLALGGSRWGQVRRDRDR
jgi:uncharacterized membrane protein YidH (DUF202 family)